MQPLIFIPPLDRASQKRITKAYLMRGLLHWITAESDVERAQAHPFQLVYTTGLPTDLWLPWHSINIRPDTPAASIYSHLLLAAKPWEDSIYEVGKLFNRAVRTAHHYCDSQLEFEDWLATAYCYYLANDNKQTFLQRYHTMTTEDQSKIPADVMTRLQSVLGDVQATLLAKDPMMPQHLRSSHQLLISYPETVHLLTDDQVALLISAAQEHTKTMIVSAAAKKATVGKKPKAEKFDISEL